MPLLSSRQKRQGTLFGHGFTGSCSTREELGASRVFSARGVVCPCQDKVALGWKRQALAWELSWHLWSLWTESRPPPFFVCFQSKGALETLLFYESKGVRSRLPVVTGYTLGSKT